jgi:hypothetical protein
MKRALPAYELCQRREFGTTMTRHSIKVDGVEIHCQMSPYSKSEAEDRVRSYQRPATPAKVYTAARGYNTGRRAKSAEGDL